eukprot:TRINITY_DN19169_c0_g1_i4.p1 TRINITY_DN19169_c0_g1~~TRINITY_DN19169_c0_g1_i4.p1  ORF type:complete len:948 (+),score=180.09 TRINITY_DN19169_c0_g1_i4:52-2895(+)
MATHKSKSNTLLGNMQQNILPRTDHKVDQNEKRPLLSGEKDVQPREFSASMETISSMSSASSLISMEERKFRWNGRECKGNAVHVAALQGCGETAAALLDAHPEAINSKFTYLSFPNGVEQIYTGEAMHLAASRSHLHVVKMLLERRAEVDAMVSRNAEAHYNVLHAAVFAEGRGGRKDMVSYLINQKASLSKNLNNQWPLHLAFQTGATAIINIVRDAMLESGAYAQMREENIEPSPLVLGIQTGKMTERELAFAAALNSESLHNFIHHDAQCVPAFLSRVEAAGGLPPASLAECLACEELARLLREAPAAAVALLDAVTREPECEGEGWHPLPSRICFAPNGFLERVRYFLNPNRRARTFYEHDLVWRYDVNSFTAPEWHERLLLRPAGWPVQAADIKVCHVPDVIQAEFFAAIVAAIDPLDAESLKVYSNPVVYASIDKVFWSWACKADLIQVFVTLWGLVLLLTESWLVLARNDISELAGHALEVFPRHLAHAAHMSGNASPRLFDHPESKVNGLHLLSVSTSFIGVKGVVDFGLEAMQLAGLWKIGQVADYLEPGNAADLFKCISAMGLLYDPSNRWLLVIVIFVYWARLLDFFTSAEMIASAILPIKNLARGLGPALTVTLIGFTAFTHAFFIVQGMVGKVWPETIFTSFSTLITAGLPSNPYEYDSLELLLTYGAVLFFSVFFLNIFIGVISIQYETEKERFPLTFQHLRAESCANFMLRAKVMPCTLLSKGLANFMVVLAIVTGGVVQTVGLYRGVAMPWTVPLFGLCQSIMFLAAFQDPARMITQPCGGCGGGEGVQRPVTPTPLSINLSGQPTAISRERSISPTIRKFSPNERYLWFALPRQTTEMPCLPDRSCSRLLGERSRTHISQTMVREIVRDELKHAEMKHPHIDRDELQEMLHQEFQAASELLPERVGEYLNRHKSRSTGSLLKPFGVSFP